MFYYSEAKCLFSTYGLTLCLPIIFCINFLFTFFIMLGVLSITYKKILVLAVIYISHVVHYHFTYGVQLYSVNGLVHYFHMMQYICSNYVIVFLNRFLNSVFLQQFSTMGHISSLKKNIEIVNNG